MLYYLRSLISRTDKLLHLLACAVIVLAVFVFCLCFGTGHPWFALIVADIIGVAAGIVKEVYDGFNPEGHTSETDDLMADFIGILLADIPILLLCLTL